ncbi:hypothetical protein FHG89_10410 [Micromonospora orduensis]|uniref:Uncharacterized protein n=1 Tax=Micromonospora orduensis TaxID=1420891 RepID=A0A5C4QSX3_9ACTN|nr:hypothetical protein [Micromonospora orduensis]TNH29911.1 hypothetical protein FHG89_10410 [Micromonospora orduensis]
MNLAALRVLAPVTVLAGLTACTTASPDPVAGAGATTPAPSATPSSATTSGDASSTPSAAPSPSASTRGACPVSAATLHKAAGLGSTHRIDPDHIKCARRWATAGVIAVDPAQQGDGVIVFEYAAGRWKKIGEGSALECSSFGIPNEIGDQIGCHDQ